MGEAELAGYERLGSGILVLPHEIGKEPDYNVVAPMPEWHAVVVAAKDLCALMVTNQSAEADGPPVSTS